VTGIRAGKRVRVICSTGALSSDLRAPQMARFRQNHFRRTNFVVLLLAKHTHRWPQWEYRGRPGAIEFLPEEERQFAAVGNPEK